MLIYINATQAYAFRWISAPADPPGCAIVLRSCQALRFFPLRRAVPRAPMRHREPIALKFRRASAIVISKDCCRLGTSTFAHRSIDRTNAPAAVTGLRKHILLLARFAPRQEGTLQAAKDGRREPLSEFAWSLEHLTVRQFTSQTGIWFPNLVTVGQKVDQICPDWLR
jgi:hypothetical protein